MPVTDPVLSICVPTFNRRRMLERNLAFHLQAFRARRIAFEIVVVDDCSTDGTADDLAALAHVPELSIHRRHRNSGFLDNYAFAMRRARGRYAVFLGDDDLLIPDEVTACVARLEADPRIGMIQAPWELVDERPNGKAMGPFYHLPQEARFMSGQYGALAQFIFDFHVFPEFFIVRREMLARTISSACPFIFWAFLFVARALGRADVVFTPTPFVRVTAVSNDPRDQQGNRETMFQWDHYRGGVEYIVALALRDNPAPIEARTATTDAINRFMLIRQKVALRLLVASGHWPEAYVLTHRIAAYEPFPISADELQAIGKLAGMTIAAREAAMFSAGPAVVDPLIDDTMLSLFDAATRSRLLPFSEAPEAGEDPRAYLRLDPAFPTRLGPRDAVFDANDYIAQFTPISG